MASKRFNRSGPINVDVNPSPETMYHFPISPAEPGKFDFYRVHLANQAHYSDPMFLDNYDAPTLSAPKTSSSSIGQRRWTPFADIVAADSSKSSLLSNASSSNSIPTSTLQTVYQNDSSVSSNTNGVQNEPIKSVPSFSSLTDLVKNAMHKGHLDVPPNQMRRPSSGATLSTKDLNHLSPQSM